MNGWIFVIFYLLVCIWYLFFLSNITFIVKFFVFFYSQFGEKFFFHSFIIIIILCGVLLVKNQYFNKNHKKLRKRKTFIVYIASLYLFLFIFVQPYHYDQVNSTQVKFQIIIQQVWLVIFFFCFLVVFFWLIRFHRNLLCVCMFYLCLYMCVIHDNFNNNFYGNKTKLKWNW